MHRALGVFVLLLVTVAPLQAEDWPEYRGKGRTGEWTETGIIERFPQEGLKVLWRTPIREGYSSPVVSGGRVFITDFTRTKGDRGDERVLALDEKTGAVLWTAQWFADYGGFMWPNGPRATATVDGDRVYILGAKGLLQCFDVKTGHVIWKRDYIAEYKVGNNGTGSASSPVVEGPLIIAMVGGEPDAMVVAWDKLTGKEAWRALQTTSDPGVGQPIIITAAGVRQMIIWNLDGVRSLDPASGKVYWHLPFKAMPPMNIPMPTFVNGKLLVSNFYTGSMLAQLDDKTPTATMLWKGNSDSEISTDGLHSVIGAPIILGDYIYGTCSYGQLRALRLSTGERVWETQAVTKERARWASAHIVKHLDHVFISNDRGELIIATFTPEGYQEIDRTNLLKPTSPPGIRRQLGNVTVVHPAYANKHIYMRNDEELVAVTMAAADYEQRFSGPVTRAPEPQAAAARSVVPTAPNRVEIQYIPSMVKGRRIGKDVEYSSIYMLLGGGGHSLAFTAEKGLVLVNTKSPGWGGAIKDRMPEITEAPLAAIINTQPGLPYTGSNSAFAPTVPIVAHENTLKAMKTMASFQGANEKFLPNRTFRDRLTLFEGKSRVDVYYFGPAHTNGDAVVAIPASNIAYLGELFAAREVPVIDRANGGSALSFPDTLARAVAALKAAEVEFIVPGRAEPRRGRQQVDVMSIGDLEEYAEFTRAVVTAATSALRAGKTVDEVASTLQVPAKFKGYGTAALKAHVQAIQDELKP